MSVFCLAGTLFDVFNSNSMLSMLIRWKRMSWPKKLGALGFWDLVCLNQSMLAKQRWWLLLYDYLLVTKVL